MNIKKIYSENRPKNQCLKLGPFKMLLMCIEEVSITFNFLTPDNEIS